MWHDKSVHVTVMTSTKTVIHCVTGSATGRHDIHKHHAWSMSQVLVYLLHTWELVSEKLTNLFFKCHNQYFIEYKRRPHFTLKMLISEKYFLTFYFLDQLSRHLAIFCFISKRELDYLLYVYIRPLFPFEYFAFVCLFEVSLSGFQSFTVKDSLTYISKSSVFVLYPPKTNSPEHILN